MVYDGWHATPEDHGNHRGLGARYRRGRGALCPECAKFYDVPNLDHNITVYCSTCVWQSRSRSCTREPASRLTVYRFRTLELDPPRYCQLWCAARTCSRFD